LSTPLFIETMRFLIGKRVVRNVALAVMVAAMLSLSTAQYLTSFFMRAHGMVIGQAVLRVALIFGLAGAVGTYLGGYIGNRLAVRDPGAATTLIAWCYLGAMPLIVLAFLAPDPTLATGLLMLGVGLQAGYFGPTFAVLHASVQPSMRGTAVALVLLVSNLIGYGLGPPIVGKMSDLLGRYFAGGSASSQQFCASNSWFAAACSKPAAGGLQFALALLALANVWAFFHFRTLSRLHRQEHGSGKAAIV
jgi:predicted MFS family arabinose efflux permease